MFPWMCNATRVESNEEWISVKGSLSAMDMVEENESRWFRRVKGRNNVKRHVDKVGEIIVEGKGGGRWLKK